MNYKQRIESKQYLQPIKKDKKHYPENEGCCIDAPIT